MGLVPVGVFVVEGEAEGGRTALCCASSSSRPSSRQDMYEVGASIGHGRWWFTSGGGGGGCVLVLQFAPGASCKLLVSVVSKFFFVTGGGLVLCSR